VWLGGGGGGGGGGGVGGVGCGVRGEGVKRFWLPSPRSLSAWA